MSEWKQNRVDTQNLSLLVSIRPSHPSRSAYLVYTLSPA